MSFIRFFILSVLFFCTAQLFVLNTKAQAADWRDCEKMKLRQLQAEHGARGRSGGKKPPATSGAGPSKSRQSIDKIEEWLWKNCSNYAQELRNLEQQKM